MTTCFRNQTVTGLSQAALKIDRHVPPLNRPAPMSGSELMASTTNYELRPGDVDQSFD
jgi:hypothetical protein